MNLTTFKHIRQHNYESFERDVDALFHLCDALRCESQARRLPELLQWPLFERTWSSMYQALEHSRINEEKLCQMEVNTLLKEVPGDQTIWISVDASSIARSQSETSEDRGIIHVCNLPRICKPIRPVGSFS